MRIQNATQKSTRGDMMLATGIIRRGKYTFVMIFALLTMLIVDLVIPSANKVQGSNAASENKGYGTPSDGIFASPPKNSENTTIRNNG